MLNLIKALVSVGAAIAFGGMPAEESLEMARVTGAASDLQTALARHPWPEAVQERRARLVLVMGWYEGAWQASPPGSNDSGRACGVMQVHSPQWDIAGATCEAVRADRVLGFEVGIVRLQTLEARCGSIAAGLAAYATDGRCGKQLGAAMSWRCRRAGLDARTCE